MEFDAIWWNEVFGKALSVNISCPDCRSLCERFMQTEIETMNELESTLRPWGLRKKALTHVQLLCVLQICSDSNWRVDLASCVWIARNAHFVFLSFSESWATNCPFKLMASCVARIPVKNAPFFFFSFVKAFHLSLIEKTVRIGGLDIYLFTNCRLVYRPPCFQEDSNNRKRTWNTMELVSYVHMCSYNFIWWT